MVNMPLVARRQRLLRNVKDVFSNVGPGKQWAVERGRRGDGRSERFWSGHVGGGDDNNSIGTAA